MGQDIDFKRIASSLLANSRALLRQWLPNGKLKGKEYTVGSIKGEAGDSLSVNVNTGVWSDFSSLEGGADLISLYAAINGLSQGDAASALSHTQIHEAAPIPAPDTFVMGVRCENIPYKLRNDPSGIWDYLTPDGEYYCSIFRFDLPSVDGKKPKKDFYPLTCWRTKTGKLKWEWKKAPAAIISPYRIEKINISADCPILVVEGEKKADSAQKLLPNWHVLGYMGGAQAVNKTNWSILAGRKVWYWPDLDKAGAKAAIEFSRHVPQAVIVTPPAGMAEGWDLADALPDFPVMDYLMPARAIALPQQPMQLVRKEKSTGTVIINGVKHEKIVDTSIHNVMLLLETDNEIKDCLIYNIFADDVFFIHCPPWESPADFKPHPLREDEILCFRAWVETRGLKCSKNDAFDILISYARRNTVNPPKEYFETLVWDGVPRLDNMLPYYFGADQQPIAYLHMVGAKWMIGVVSRIYEPGCKFDTALILEGEQYIGKSRALEILATVNGERYFTDENIDFRSKDSLIILQGKLIIEMAELASFKKSETDLIKGFMTRRIDEYRPPYSIKSIARPRMFALAGSVNPNAGYLTDPTGNRRVWPVLCGNKIDHDALEADRQQLWAEAIHRYKAKERIYLLDAEYALAKIEQADRMISDMIEEEVARIAQRLVLENWSGQDFMVNDIAEELKIPIEKRDGKMKSRIVNILQVSGFEEYKPRQTDGKQKRKWRARLIVDTINNT